ncbi:MAG: alpha/beta hydrolase [Robiginitalea sp.]|jgi:predicted alpha/beta hydrolase
MAYREEIVQFPTRAGHSLTGTLFTPENPAGHSLLISSATGMLRRFYHAFSKHFASKGYAVLTFDYHGIGDSAGSPEALKKNRYDLAHWGSNDQAGAVRFLKSAAPENSVSLVTHSIGGQICGFNPEHKKIDRIIMVASQTGYWGLFEGWHKYKMWFFWHAMVPWTTPFFGYFPSGHLGLFENLPREMASQWSQWGKRKEYMMAFRNSNYLFDQLRMPILSLSFPGDHLAPEATVDWLARQYPNAEVNRVHYTREGRAPGHFGYFRPRFERTLWDFTHQWITRGEWGS